MVRLEDELKEKNRLEKEGVGLITHNPPELTPQQKVANAEADLKSFKLSQDLDSIKLGYDSFKVREQAQADKEKNVADREDAISKREEELESKRQAIIDEYTPKIKNFNEKYELLQTKITEYTRLTEEAMKAKSEAESIKKAQTESEKVTQEKKDAYDKNIEEAIKVFTGMGNTLVKYGSHWGDGKLLSVGKVIKIDSALIERMQQREHNNSSIADVISCDIDRVIEVGEYLQDNSEKLQFDSIKLLNYLLKNTKWLSSALLIKWTPPAERGFRI